MDNRHTRGARKQNSEGRMGRQTGVRLNKLTASELGTLHSTCMPSLPGTGLNNSHMYRPPEHASERYTCLAVTRLGLSRTHLLTWLPVE